MAVQLGTLTGLVPYPVEQALRSLANETDGLAAQIAGVARQQRVPLTLDQIRQALGATGSLPLNIFNLLGGSAGSGAVTLDTHTNRLATNPITAGNGALWLETDRLALYGVISSVWTLVGSFIMRGTVFSANQRPTDLGTADAGFLFLGTDATDAVWRWSGTAWVYLKGSSSGLRGTLNPDQKPTLTANDADFRFVSTDFIREYRWSGTAWEDAPGQPKRVIEWIPYSIDSAVFDPGTGWQLCNGTVNVRISKPDGTTVLITVPDLTTATRFLRAVAGATGGVGGSATTHTHAVDPPNTTTGNESATQEVFTGVGTIVAAAPHTHDVNIASFNSGAPSGAGGDDALPPYYNARPYLRL